MNIQQNLHFIGQKIIQSEQATKKYKLGLAARPAKLNILMLVQQYLVIPLCQTLSKQTGSKVTFKSGVSPNFFWMETNYRRFAILSLPNPTTSRAFIQYLNRKGQVCSERQEIHNTLQPICDYIKLFNSTTINSL